MNCKCDPYNKKQYIFTLYIVSTSNEISCDNSYPSNSQRLHFEKGKETLLVNISRGLAKEF